MEDVISTNNTEAGKTKREVIQEMEENDLSPEKKRDKRFLPAALVALPTFAKYVISLTVASILLNKGIAEIDNTLEKNNKRMIRDIGLRHIYGNPGPINNINARLWSADDFDFIKDKKLGPIEFIQNLNMSESVRMGNIKSKEKIIRDGLCEIKNHIKSRSKRLAPIIISVGKIISAALSILISGTIVDVVGEAITDKVKKEYYDEQMAEIERNIQFFEYKYDEFSDLLRIRNKRQIALAAFPAMGKIFNMLGWTVAMTASSLAATAIGGLVIDNWREKRTHEALNELEDRLRRACHIFNVGCIDG